MILKIQKILHSQQKQVWVKWDPPKHMHIKIKQSKEEHSGESLILGNPNDWIHMWSAHALIHAAWRTNRKT